MKKFDEDNGPIFTWALLLLLALMWLYLLLFYMPVNAQPAPGSIELLDSYMFLLDAKIKERPHVVILIGPAQPDYIGRVRRMPDNSIELLLDEQFFLYYEGRPQVTRLIYHLMGLQYRMKTRRGFMATGRDYYVISYNRLLRTFKYERRKIHKASNNKKATNQSQEPGNKEAAPEVAPKV